jgi:hypothetical protein
MNNQKTKKADGFTRQQYLDYMEGITEDEHIKAYVICSQQLRRDAKMVRGQDPQLTLLMQILATQIDKYVSYALIKQEQLSEDIETEIPVSLEEEEPLVSEPPKEEV